MVRLILTLFVAVAFNAIHNGAIMGQDFSVHLTSTNRLLREPDKWFAGNITNRPMLYWIGGWCVWFSHDKYPYQLASMLFTLSGAAALGFLHDATRRVIISPLLRVTGLALLAFLPLTVLTTVVYAADTVALLPFVLAGWSVMRSLEQDSGPKAVGFAALAGVAFSIGDFAKATFLCLPAAVVFVLLALWRSGRLTAQRGWMLLALGVVLPSAVGGWVVAKCARQIAGEPEAHSFNWHGTGELTFRSLVGVKVSDRRVLDAPEYLATEMRSGVQIYPLLIENDYSYPALLHLGIFTDLLNVANSAIVPRPEPQRTLARRTVRLGLVFSLGALAAVLAFWGLTFRGFFRPSHMPSTAALVWSSLAMAWYVPIAGALPFVNHAYIMGYWLPRLVLPALWIFFLSLFAAADRLPGRWRGAAGVILAILVPILSVLEIRSFWY